MGYQKTTHVVSIYRIEKTGNKEAYGGTPVYTGIDIGIFPAQAEILAVYPSESAFSLHEGYIYEYCVLENGDKLIDAGGGEWILRGVPQVYDTNLLYYQRLVLEKVVGS